MSTQELFGAVVAFLLGGLSWTLTEYVMHRFWGHAMKGRSAFSREHLRHHAEVSYFAPTAKKVLTATPPVTILALGGSWLAGPWLGLGFAVGFTATYIGYEVVHRRIHVAPPTGAYGRFVRRHHLMHHFTCPKDNHGVTSPLWDWVFGTWRRPEVVRVPRKHALPWLLEPGSRTMRAEFESDYRLTGRANTRAA